MDKPTTVNLGSIDQIPIGQAGCFIINGEEIAVARPRSGGIFAVENRCPHRRGPLSEGVVGDGKIVCPLHGHKFDLATGKGNDAQECVRTFKVLENDGKILMEYLSGSVASEPQFSLIE